LRSVLEPFALELGRTKLATESGRKDLAEAVRTLEKCARERDSVGVLDSHLAVHRALYHAAGNQVLIDLWESWENLLKLYLAEQHQTHALYMAESHRRLLINIESGDFAEASSLLANHFGPPAASTFEPRPAVPRWSVPDLEGGRQ
jgi:DNA-binding GntR family transcriptional regulator